MNRVFVLDINKQPLSPCHPARARKLLRKGKAVVFRRYPFTIILKNRLGGDVPSIELKFDPGSKITGVALVQQCKTKRIVIFAAEISHRGQQIKKSLDSRRAIRRNRRYRKTRYRKPRFKNRTRHQGWLPPSILSRVNNVSTWAKRLKMLSPIASIAIEIVRFDPQKIDNPEIGGIEYQLGALAGYELREYLLEKFKRKCVYCGSKNVPLQIEHVIPRSKGGSNRASNLTLSCQNCNVKKGTRDVREFLAEKPGILNMLLKQLKFPLKDAAAVNTTRYVIGDVLKNLEIPISFWSGGRTKYNRTQQHYPKAHWIDAACVGETGRVVSLNQNHHPLVIISNGHGKRQMCRMDKFGFPRTGAKKTKTVQGFKTGDMVKAVVPMGRKKGTYIGRLAIRTTGNFNISAPAGTIQGINYRHCYPLHRADGYSYKNSRPLADRVLGQIEKRLLCNDEIISC